MLILTLFASCTTEYIEAGDAYVELDYPAYTKHTDVDFWGNHFNHHDINFEVVNTGGRTAYDVNVSFIIYTRRNSVVKETVYLDHLRSDEAYSSFIHIDLTNDQIDHYRIDTAWRD